MTRYVVFDLDGCLSNDHPRRHLLPPKGTTDPSAYDAYNAAAVNDNAMNVYPMWANLPPNHKALFVTARPCSMRIETERFIKTSLGLKPNDFALIMRPDANTQPSPELKVRLLLDAGVLDRVAAAFDDRSDVLNAYRSAGIPHAFLMDLKGCRVTSALWMPDGPSDEEPPKSSAATVLSEMAATFEERNAVYKDNYKQVPVMLRAMFPDGLPDGLAFEDHFHLLELILVKLTRFGQSGAKHVDSIHDIAIYAAMIEAILKEKQS